MDTRTGKIRSSGTRYLPRAALLSLAVGTVLAAALFIANNQPYGYVAPPALSSANFSRGDVIIYTPWFETGTFRGELMALPVSASGVVSVLNPDWRASTVLDGQNFLIGRRIVTSDGLGNGIPFQFANLTPAQQGQVGSAIILAYIRGDRSNESAAGLRVRSSVLGDIIHSGPVYVGKPKAGYDFGGYLAFANANAGRAPRVYVGANDGMLHAFDAADGSEVFAYVPSMVMGNLPKLAVQPYKHQYFVDGFLTVADAQFGASWHSVLVGGLGAGGKGYYGLDVTSAAAATEVAAAGKILWEFNSASPGAANLGYSYSRPSIARLNNGAWGAVVGNGYLSATGVASLYLLNVQTGAVIREIAVPDLAANGLSSPTLIDTNADGLVDVAYAGDLNGNLWKFDLQSTNPAAWSVAYGGKPLFQTALTGTVRQPITTAPEVGHHPLGGVMVYVGTGRLFSAADIIDKTTQAVYGIWDNSWAAASVPISSALLVTQQLKKATHASGAAVRVVTANTPNWSIHRGWMTPTQVAGTSTLDLGERVLQDLILRDGRVQFMTVNPSTPSGENWFLQLNALTGGAPRKTIIDLTGDFLLDVQDNVDGNGDLVIADVAEDRVVGEYQQFGLASRPVAGILNIGSDASLINHLVAIAPVDGALTGDPLDPGLLGGHFDVDTSHLIYPFNGGETDGHVHQWDDKHDLTTIDYFGFPPADPLYEINSPLNGVSPSTPFILAIANDDLSPGGILEINSSSISVGDYRRRLEGYLQGSVRYFPLFKLNKPTPAEALAGVVQLTSLKLSFDAFVILGGGLLPTKTGCVQANAPGLLSEYRNGALLLQALNATDVSGGFVLDPVTQRYVAGSTALHSSLGYATTGLLWESTVFWHWEGPCYGDPLWAPLYDTCIIQGLGGCYQADAEEVEKAEERDEDDDDGPPPPAGDPVPPVGDLDPGHTVTNTTVGGDNAVGRLFWREVIPEQ